MGRNRRQMRVTDRNAIGALTALSRRTNGLVRFEAEKLVAVKTPITSHPTIPLPPQVSDNYPIDTATLDSALANLHFDRPRNRCHFGVVILIDPRLERSRANGVLGAQTVAQHDAVSRGD